MYVLKIQTRNPHPVTRNPHPVTRNPQPVTRNSKPATRNPQLGTRNPHPAPPSTSYNLIPGYFVHTVLTSFIVFQVGQHTGIHPNVKIVRFINAERYDISRHIPTM